MVKENELEEIQYTVVGLQKNVLGKNRYTSVN